MKANLFLIKSGIYMNFGWMKSLLYRLKTTGHCWHNPHQTHAIVILNLVMLDMSSLFKPSLQTFKEIVLVLFKLEGKISLDFLVCFRMTFLFFACSCHSHISLNRFWQSCFTYANGTCSFYTVTLSYSTLQMVVYFISEQRDFLYEP